MTREEVLEKFHEGFDCGQVVFSSLAKEVGVDEQTANKVASCFGAGLFNADVCGALTGALMTLGMKYGHSEAGQLEVKGKMIGKCTTFQTKFKKQFGCTTCSGVLGYNLTIPEEMAQIDKLELLQTVCPKVVIQTIELLKQEL